MTKRYAVSTTPYTFQMAPHEVAYLLKIPAKSISSNPKQTNEILRKSYEIAKKTGYLASYERARYLDIFVLNHEKFERRQKEKLIESPNQDSTEKQKIVESLFEIFYSERKKIDPKQSITRGITKIRDLKKFMQLLETRDFHEIIEVIKWGTQNKFWWTHLATPTKLLAKFSEAWGEMTLSQKNNPKHLKEVNKALAKKIEASFQSDNPKMQIDALSNFIEINDGGIHPFILNYEEKEFQKKLEHAMKQREISVSLE